jgi:hypothetical protein
MRGKLNLFQATMLRWRELHPYNAVHVVMVGQALEPARLKARIATLLESAGLTGLVVGRRGRFEYRGGTATVDVSIFAGGDDVPRAVEQEIERQLNLPFAAEGAFLPFRFFAIDAGGSFHLGLAYDHFVAGGDSIAVLLGKLVNCYCAEVAAAAAPWTPRLYPHTYTRLFRRHAGDLLRGLRRVPALAASCRRSLRAPCHAGADASNGFMAQRIDAAGVAALVRAARQWGVTRNDLFLAMLLLALAAVRPQRSMAQRRHELGVAAIVNVRGEFEADATDTFGQFLASLRVSHPVPPGTTLRELAQAIHADTTRIKTEKLYLQTLLALGAVGIAWRLLRVDRRPGFLAKHYPLWAGVTGLYVDGLWPPARGSGPLPEYLRAVPTGPLAPVVFAITTFGSVMQLGISFRRADVNRELAAALAGEFVRYVRLLDGPAECPSTAQ